MSTLSEREVWDRLRTSLRSAIDLCGKLATVPAQGPNYQKLTEDLGLIEGACRQVGAFRFDMRWNRLGYEVARFHHRIGDCLRARAARTIFLAQAEMLKSFLELADKLRTAKTGRRGPILPREKQAPHRQNRPVAVKLPSGLLVPASALH